MSPAILEKYNYKVETFDKCPILFQFKAAVNFEPEEYYCISRIKNSRLTQYWGKRGCFTKVSGG
jgi:hypothetical protein